MIRSALLKHYSWDWEIDILNPEKKSEGINLWYGIYTNYVYIPWFDEQINFENFLSFEQISDDYIKTEYILHV